MDFEYLYILENENIPKLVKFGFTKNHPRERAKQLSADTGVPGRYRIIKFWRVKDGFKWEQYVFKKLSSYRKTGEFLKLTPQEATDKIEIILSEAEATTDYKNYEIEQSRIREKELYEEEQSRNLQEKWDKNLYRIENQAKAEAEKRLGFTYFSIRSQIEKINKNSIAVKTQETFNFVWMGINFFLLFVPMILFLILRNTTSIKNISENWVSDSLDGGKSTKKINELSKKEYQLNDERDRLIDVAKLNFFKKNTVKISTKKISKDISKNLDNKNFIKKNGKGTYTYANGDKYIGEFKDNFKHGNGTYIHSNGNKYEGEYKYEKKHGQGIFTWKDGSKFSGQWKNNNKHGKGIYTYYDISLKRYVKQKGVWKDGIFQTKS